MLINPITVTEIEVETSYGMTVTYSRDNPDEVFKQTGCSYPIAWTNPEMSCDEFNRQETISEAVLEGRKAGAKREAEVLLAQEIYGDEAEDMDYLDLSNGFTIPDTVIQEAMPSES